MWYIANYEPTTFFSLRPANATTSGGKTLLTPTPYAVKMALLDAAIRIYGVAIGEIWFPRLRDLRVAVQLPDHLVVINTFIRILRPHKSGPKDVFGTGLKGPLGNTIAYRELVQFGGTLRLAIQDANRNGESPPLVELLPQIHYLGKRGGFFQFKEAKAVGSLSPAFTRLNPDPNNEQTKQFDIHGTLQLLDDCGHKMSFAHASVFSGKSLSVGNVKGRILNPIVLPYRLARSSKSYSLYERIA